MLKFQVFDDGKPAQRWPLRNAYLLGSDNNALRASIVFQDGEIRCTKRDAGVAALAIQHPIGECGELTVQTTHLPEREEPYLLCVELARHRLMMLYAKLEDWGMFDLPAEHAVTKRLELARKQFLAALSKMADDPAGAEKLARESLNASIDASEELAIAHADLLLNRRRATNQLPRYVMGCGVALEQTSERMRNALQSNFDFVAVPTPWKTLTPEEGSYRWALVDNWIEWAGKARLPVIAGPLVCFQPNVLPDWLFIWEHDYDTVRDVIYEHVESLVTRYRNAVSAYTVVGGLHVNNHFTFSFEQLIDLTRMTAILVKKVQPLAKVLVELRQPFGEYFASNARSIPPKMYADMLIQNGVHFDALVVRLLMGQSVPGQFTRDLMQASNLLDELAQTGKPMHVMIGAPSDPVTPEMIAMPDTAEPVDPNSGHWRKPWSSVVQARWMEAVSQVALSKPFVESVIWSELMDHPQIDLPMSGLINEDNHPKASLRRSIAFRRWLQQGHAAG